MTASSRSVSAPEAGRPPAERITVALIPTAAVGLALLQDRTGLSKTNVVNRAVTLYGFVDAQIAAGSELLVRAADGTVQVVKLL